MMERVICIFGEAGKGIFETFLPCHSLIELYEFLGNPPNESLGIAYAVQSILFNHSVLFYRVDEEGSGVEKYRIGLEILEKKGESPAAICMPGVGDATLIERVSEFCLKRGSLLVMNEKDFYDYVTTAVSSK